MSHPSRVRGLKQNTFGLFAFLLPSHPSRVRGLKRVTCGCARTHQPVAPFTGAWVETEHWKNHGDNLRCRTLHGCVG